MTGQRVVLALILTSVSVVVGQSYGLKTAVIDGGGERLASSGYRAGLSVGQPVASGVLTSSQHKAVLGFWHNPYGGGVPGLAEPTVGSQAMPLVFGLGYSFPNPFAGKTAISYSLARESDVALRVYNSAGRAVTTLVSGRQRSDRYTVSWDVSGVPAAKLPRGTYFCRLEAGEFTATRKMVKSE